MIKNRIIKIYQMEQQIKSLVIKEIKMKKIRNVISFLFFIVLFFMTHLDSKGLCIRNYADKDGLSMNIGVSIVQDKKGYIWIATQNGLNRFDGFDFKHFTKEDGLPNNFVNHLYIDKKDNLWVSTRGGLALYKNGGFVSYTTEKDDLFKNNCNCTKESKKHGLLIGTVGGLFILKDQNLVEYPTNDKKLSTDKDILNTKIRAIEVDANDNIYLGTTGHGLIIITHDEVKQIPEESGLISNHINSLLLDEEGLWIGTDAGLTLFRDGKFIKNYRKQQGLTDNGINVLFKDSKGNLWIGTQDGLNLKKYDRIIKYYVSDGLAGNNILSLCDDHEGGLWIGIYGGVSYLGVSKFTAYSIKNGLPQNACYGVYESMEGKLWVATLGGIAIIDEKNDTAAVIKSLTTTNGELPSNTTRTIDGDKDGTIWIGTAIGLVRYKNNSFKVYDKNDGLPNNYVRVVYLDSKNNLWLGMQDGGLVLFDKDNGRVREIYHSGSKSSKTRLLNDNVWFLKDDQNGNLWVGVDEGICKLDLQNEELTNFTEANGLICKDTHGILRDGEGYWIATFGEGLYYLNEHLPEGKQFKQYTIKDGLPDNCIYGIIQDKEGWLWLPTNKGVCRWDKEKKFKTYTINHGLPSNENNAHGGFMDSKGQIWFSTPRGVAWIDPDNIPTNDCPPSVYIEELKVNDKEIISKEEPLIFEHNHNKVFIKYTAISYQFPEGVKFERRLDGFHEPGKWSEPVAGNRFVEYQSLPSGDYKFKVRAYNSDGIPSKKEATLAFSIKKTFFETSWFYLLLGLAVIVLGYLLSHYRIVWQKQQREKLKQEVRERTKELEEAQVKLIQQGKMATLGEMAAGLAHEMNNPANYIYGNIDLLQNFINDIKSILTEYMKVTLPKNHKATVLKTKLNIDNKMKELDGMIGYVKEGAVRIADIVMDLGYFVGKGKNESKPEPTDIHKSIETTLNLLHNKTKDLVEIKKKFGKIPVIESYTSQLNQVFMNLLLNAADAIKEKGTITIETLTEDEKNIAIKISDTGEGITPENLPQIYEPFFSTKNSDEGMGLGLTISKKIIERHRGTIEVESELGKSTTFIITLPIKFTEITYEGDYRRWEAVAGITKS